MVSTLEQMQVPNRTGPGVRRSKCQPIKLQFLSILITENSLILVIPCGSVLKILLQRKRKRSCYENNKRPYKHI